MMSLKKRRERRDSPIGLIKQNIREESLFVVQNR